VVDGVCHHSMMATLEESKETPALDKMTPPKAGQECTWTHTCRSRIHKSPSAQESESLNFDKKTCGLLVI